ncbi:hypothetical protein BGZ98_005054 [Dissophora globulifera]|nr:hypothetical protein BGZ98_005054 [Dissophora globulifera]
MYTLVALRSTPSTLLPRGASPQMALATVSRGATHCVGRRTVYTGAPLYRPHQQRSSKLPQLPSPSSSPSSPAAASLGTSRHALRFYTSKNTTAAAVPSSSAATATATATATTVSETAQAAASPKLSKFKQYAEQFKNKPASHLIAFGILHEITAVVPLPIVYFTLVETGVKIPFPDQAMEEANRSVARVAKYYGWDLEGTEGAKVMLNMATSYALVKALMP